MSNEPLQPTIQIRSETIEFNVRANASFTGTFNDSERSVEVVLATETPTIVYDFQRGERVEEILLMRGAQTPEYIPLLDNHNRYSNDNVFGAIENIRVSGGELHAKAIFTNLDEFLKDHPDDDSAKKLKRTMIKVKQRSLRGISAGYQVIRSVYIPAGESREVFGRTFTAQNVPRSIVTEWLPREGSITPVQADRFSSTRSNGVNIMPIALRQYLEKTFNLRKDATEDEAWQKYHSITDNERSDCAEHLGDVTPPEPQAGTPPSNSGTGTGGQRSEPAVHQPAQVTPEGGQRQQLANPPVATPPATIQPTEPQPGLEAIREQTIQAERQRMSDLQTLFDGQEPELLQRAINDGWSHGRAATELVPRLRNGYRSPVGSDAAGGNMGIHSRGSDDITEDVLAAALMRRTSVNVEHEFFSNYELTNNRIFARSLCNDINNDDRQRTLENSHRISRMSCVDICRHALQLRGITDFDSHNPDNIVERALSSGAVTGIFTSDVSARLMISYMDQPDTTVGWCMEEDVINFKKNERHGMGKFSKLKKHNRGGTAEDNTIDDETEEYKIARYSSKFTLDDQDIIDDNLNGLGQVAPEDMGNSARQLRPDLVYASLLSNPNMRDSVALFHADHGNYRTGAATALGIKSLESAEIAFGQQRIKDRVLNLQMKFLIVPRQLKWIAKQILTSDQRREGDAADGVANPIASDPPTVVVDDRIGPNGVIDPDTEAKQVGTATNYLITAKPRENGARTQVVGYRAGTGRSPMIRSSILNQGAWGIMWDINLDIGTKPLDWRAMQWNDGQ